MPCRPGRRRPRVDARAGAGAARPRQARAWPPSASRSTSRAILRFLPGQELLVDPADVTRGAGADDHASTPRGRTGSAPSPGPPRGAERSSSSTTTRPTPGSAPCSWSTPTPRPPRSLVEELIARLGVPLDRDIAHGLYAGLATDTGSFKYPSTTPEVHALAGRLLAAGVRPEAVSRASCGTGRRSATCRSSRARWPGPAGARRRGRPRAGLDDGARAPTATPATPTTTSSKGVIDQLRRTDEAEVAVVCKEDDRGEPGTSPPAPRAGRRRPRLRRARRGRAPHRRRVHHRRRAAHHRPVARRAARPRRPDPGPAGTTDLSERARGQRGQHGQLGTCHRGQARRLDLARRGRPDAPAGAAPAGSGTPARSTRWRPVSSSSGRQGHPPARAPGAHREGLRRHDPAGRVHQHRRRRRRDHRDRVGRGGRRRGAARGGRRR